jgi:hypothetical protein
VINKLYEPVFERGLCLFASDNRIDCLLFPWTPYRLETADMQGLGTFSALQYLNATGAFGRNGKKAAKLMAMAFRSLLWLKRHKSSPLWPFCDHW